MKSSKKLKVWVRDKWRCRYCSTKLDKSNATVDHVTPQHLGGTNDLSNLVAACRECNLKKDKEERPVIIY